MGQGWDALTTSTPKPMLKIANKPILEHIITRLKNQGFTT